MGFLIVIASCIVGAIVGGLVGDGSMAAFGFFAGLAIGIVFARLRTLSARIEALRRDVAERMRTESAATRATRRRGAATSSTFACATPPDAGFPAPPAPEANHRFHGSRRVGVAAPPRHPRAPPSGEPPGLRRFAGGSHAATPGAVENAIVAIKRWFTEGNVPVKVGMLVLFAGVAALLKYASDQGWLHAADRVPPGRRRGRGDRRARIRLARARPTPRIRPQPAGRRDRRAADDGVRRVPPLRSAAGRRRRSH